MWQIIMRNWDLREFRVRVNFPSPIQHVHVPMQRVIKYPHKRCSQLNRASCTRDISYPLVFSIWFSFSSPTSLLLVVNSTIISEYKVKSSLSISPCHDHELTPSTSIHQVQHTPSTAYTEYSVHQVEHTPSTAYTE